MMKTTSMKVLTCLLVACGALAAPELHNNDLIIPPLANRSTTASQPTVALLFAQGAGIDTTTYLPLAQEIQQAFPYDLWVGVPDCIADSAAVDLRYSMNRIKRSMSEQGMPDDTIFFFGGHSLGGAMIPDYVAAHEAETAQGMILMAAFLERKFKTGVTPEGRPQVEFPVPTLTIGGELDGLCRITRISEALYSQVSFSADPAAAMRTLPVTVLEGVNHMLFASGEPPKFVSERDLQAEVTEEEAHAMAAQDAAAFMTARITDSDEDWSVVEARVQESTDFVSPIVRALQMEGYAQFLPPCYCEAMDEYGGREYGTCKSQPNCTGGCPWTSQYAQPILAIHPPDAESVMDSDIQVVSADSLHLVTEEKPSCHLPHIHGNPVDNANPGVHDTPPLCNVTEEGSCELNITTVTQHVYHNSGELDLWRIIHSFDSDDTGFLPIASSELKVKMKSRQAIYQASGLTDVRREDTDNTANLCGQVNQAAVDWAMQQLPESTRERFAKYGQQLVIGDDIASPCAGGPCWIWDPLRFNKDDDNNQVLVQSVFMTTENANIYPCGESKLLPCDAGFHYCKLLSPARALEWMYVDGLRLNYLASNQDS